MFCRVRLCFVSVSAMVGLCQKNMQKIFDRWNERKKVCESCVQIPWFRVREVWWYVCGVNVGTEICGHGGDFCRPVLIIKWVSRRSF